MANELIPTRQAKRIVIVGTNGTGKTTLLHKIVDNAHQRTLIITSHPYEWNETNANGEPLYPLNELRRNDDFKFEGVQRHLFDPERTMKILHKFRRGLVVFDDCRTFFPDKTAESIHKILISSRQLMLDEIFVCHGVTDIPLRMFTFGPEFFMFRTTDNMDRRSRGVLNYQLIEQMQRKVNRIAVHNPFYYEYFKLV